MRNGQLRRSAIGLLVLGLLLAGCGDGEPASEPEPVDSPTAVDTSDPGEGDGADASWDDLVAEAEAEGQVTLYGAVSDAVLQDIKTGFESAYDITVELQRLNAGPQRERVDQEIATGRITGDVLLNNDTPWVESIADHLQPLDDVPARSEFPDEWWVDSMPILASFTQAVLLNTDRVALEEITEWPDVLDPKFQGRIGMLDPASGLGALTWYAAVLDSQGEEFMRQLADQDPLFFESTAIASQNVASGELDLSLLNVAYTTVPLKEQGAPVEDAYLPPVSVVGYHVVALEGPNPAAAKVLTNWLLSAEGQEAVCGDFKLTCSLPGIETSLPLPDDYIRYEPAEISERADELRELISSIFG